MAWSDAARRAAAEVRRVHAEAKRGARQMRPAGDLRALTTQEYRQRLAATIRVARNLKVGGAYAAGTTRYAAISAQKAAASTFARNYYMRGVSLKTRGAMARAAANAPKWVGRKGK